MPMGKIQSPRNFHGLRTCEEVVRPGEEAQGCGLQKDTGHSQEGRFQILARERDGRKKRSSL